MPKKRFKTEWWFPEFLRGPFERTFKALCVFGNEIQAYPPLQDFDTGRSVGFKMDPNYGYPVIPVKVTGAKDGDYYPGDVYAEGVEASASANSVDLYFPDFEVDVASSDYGFWPAIRIDDPQAGTTVYQIVGDCTWPAKASGLWLRQLDDGVYKIMDTTRC